MFDVERAMDKIFAEVSKRIKDNQYTDDWCWAEDWNGYYCIQFEVIEMIVDEDGNDIVDEYGRPVERSRGVYKFFYRQDEEHYGDMDKAIMEWINDRF